MTPEKPYSYPDLGHSFGLVAILIGFTLLVSVLLIVAAEYVFEAQLAQNNWLLLGAYSLPFILTVWIGYKKKRRRETGYRFKFKPLSAAVWILAPLLTLAVYFVVDPIIELIPMPDFFIEMMERLLSDQDIPSFLMLVAAAPLLEELLCRGLILDGLLKIYSPKKAIVWAALIFGIMHLNPWQFISGVALGILIGWLYFKTGSLWAAILVHATANGFSFVMGFFIKPSEATMTTRDWVGNDLLYSGILILCVAIIWWGIRYLNRRLTAPLWSGTVTSVDPQ